MGTQQRWSNCGDLLVWCAEFEVLLNHDLPGAQTLLKRARKLGCRDSAGYHRIHGYVLWQMGPTTEGIQELERSVALNPSVTNLTALGQALSAENDTRATSIWQRVLEQEPRNCDAHVYLALAAFKLGDRGQALLLMKRAERITQTDQAYYVNGCVYMKLGECQAAIRAYLQAERLGYQPKGPLYAAIATCYSLLGENGRARRYADWAMKHDPQHEFVKRVHTYVYEEGEEPDHDLT